MSIATFAELKTRFLSWINRDDLDGEIPGFITLIEADMKRRIRLRDLKSENTAFAVAAESVTLPSDCREIINFYHNEGRVPIRRVAVQEAAVTGNYNGKPTEYYVLDDTTIKVSPPPDQSYDTTIYYSATFTPLVSDTDTNAILMGAPDIYLHGLMAYGAAFIEDDQRAATHQAVYDAALQNHQDADVKSRYSGPLSPKLRNVV